MVESKQGNSKALELYESHSAGATISTKMKKLVFSVLADFPEKDQNYINKNCWFISNHSGYPIARTITLNAKKRNIIFLNEKKVFSKPLKVQKEIVKRELNYLVK